MSEEKKTLAETIRAQLTPMEIRMAVAAIEEGVAAIKERSKDDYGDDKIRSYKRGFAHAGEDTASEVPFELFACCSAECKMAMEKMAKEDIWLFGDKIPVFDRFVDELYKRCGTALKIREVKKVEIF